MKLFFDYIPERSINSQCCDSAQVDRGHYYSLATRVGAGVGAAVDIVAVVVIMICVIVEVSAGTSTSCCLPLAVCFAKLSVEE